MVVSARLAAGFSGLRNRNTRVTNKTQLRIVRGSIEADPIIIDDEDDEKNRILASQGVDEEDANEHHLQAALFASSQRSLPSSQFKSSTSANDTSAYIPTPDAAGLVAEYDTLYPAGKQKDPATHLRFSDSLDESCIGGLSGSYTYFLDERDAEWLERNNGAARGEGTSANGGTNGTHGSNSLNGTNHLSRGIPRAPHSRSAKSKGKEPECRPPNITYESAMVINEDHFELVMGLFEKWTDESVSPYLHVAHDPEHFPGFADYERFFSKPLLPSTFANFTIPPNVPPPEQMVQIARAIYPWWKERRIERQGHRVVPPLDVLIIEAQEKEDKTGGSPYICFRKRDVKPMRKTRTNNITHTEKLIRLRGELQTSLELAQMVLRREKLKSDSVAAAEFVWRRRESLSESMKQLNSLAPGTVLPGDESLLFDKERKPRKQKVETTASGRIILTNRRLSQARPGLSDSLDPHSPLTLNGDTSHAFEFCQTRPSARAAEVQREVDLELAKARKDDVYWDDVVDMPHQALPVSIDEKFFKPATSTNAKPTSSTSSLDAQLSSSHSLRTSRSVRLRTGRGGRLHLDRQLHISRPHRLLQREWAGYPSRAVDHSASQEDVERWAPRSWRPRHETGEHVRLGRKERQLGEEYWAHPSVYDSQEALGVLDQAVAQASREAQDPIIGFEQSGFGWDGHRGPWARARTGRDDEGWKPTPFLAVDSESLGAEVATQNAAERERLVEAWRDGTVDDVSQGDGGALALFMDGGAPENSGGQDEMSLDPDVDQDADGRSVEAERAWRVDERWRYDSESDMQVDSEDRFLLDDYQPKFIRTTITLLDAQDHDTISTDPQYLEPPPLKQNRYLDHQLRLQNPGLPQPSASGSGSTPTTTFKPLPPRQMPPPSRPGFASPTPLQIGNGVSTPLSLSPAQNLTPTVNSNGNTNGNGMSVSNSSSARSVSPPKPLNGTNALGLTPSGARIPPDSSSGTIRVNTPVRTKHPSVGMSLPQAGLPTSYPPGATNGHSDVVSPGPFQQHGVQPYPSLKSALGRVLVSQQDSQQQGRMFQKPVSNNVNGANAGDPASMTLPLNVNNVHLKMPSQRAAQIRTHGNVENHGTNTSIVDTPAADHYSHARIPSNGSRQT